MHQKLIVFVGQLVEVKGFDYLICALKRVGEMFKGSYALAVVGDGPLRKTYEGEIMSLGLADRVNFMVKRSTMRYIDG